MERHTTDIEEMTLNDSKILRSSFEKLEKPHEFKRFDYYLIEKWSDTPGKINYAELDKKDINKLRKKAFNNFNDVIKEADVADTRTIRKWFGINGYVAPKREVFYKAALALGLSTEETEDYMVNGMMIPSFQINDYQEIIYLYGIHNHLSYDYCRSMIDVFEEKMGYDIVYKQENHTERLWKEFALNKNITPEKFLKWMLKQKNMFKGYSKTVLDYFILLKEEIGKYIKKDEKDYLIELLTENGYEKWMISDRYSRYDDNEKNQAAFIRHLSRSKKDKVDKGILDSMRNAYNIVYGDAGDSDFIREIYPRLKGDKDNSIYKEKISELKNNGISFMSNKYLSQILSVAEQKANYMRMKNIRMRVLARDEEELCPDEYYEYVVCMGKTPENRTVKETLKVIDEYIMNQNQRCQLIGRDDILPMIHYIAQKRYAALLKEDKRDYNMEEARAFFRNVADAILSKCGMALISTKYKSDYYMLASFSKEDMYSLADMIEISVQV